MRVYAIACAAIVFGQATHARDVALSLDWPDAAPATEIVAVARDGTGAVLEVQRLSLTEGTRDAILPLPSLSRQATTLQVGALLGGAFALQSARAVVDGGQPPERLQLSAALTAGFTADYLCNSGQVVSLWATDDRLWLRTDMTRSYIPTGETGRFQAEDGRAVARIPGLLQLKDVDGARLDRCQPIPARPILPLTARGIAPPTAEPWQVLIGPEGAVASWPGQPAPEGESPAPRIATAITVESGDRMRFDMGAHSLTLTHSACRLPGQSMPYPYRAALSGPDGPFAPGCAGDPLHALEGRGWHVSHVFGLPVAHGEGGAPGMTLQVDTGHVSGRTSCNRYLGRAMVVDGMLRISQLGTTRLPCAADLFNLETRFLDALEAATDIALLPNGRVALYAGATAVVILEPAI